MPDASTAEWKRLAGGEFPPAQIDGKGIWDSLRDHINPALHRPVQSPDASAIPLTSRHGEPYYILTNRKQYGYLRLAPEDYYIWSLMDGTRSVKDLVVEYFMKFGTLAFGLVGQFVTHLRYAQMLVETPTNVYGALHRALDKRDWRFLPRLLWQIISGQRKFTIRHVDATIDWVYRRGGWILYTRPMQLLYLGLCGFGGWLFLRHMNSSQFNLFQLGGSYLKGMLVLYALNYTSIAIHELAHALTCKHFGARVNGAGVMLYFGMPAFYIDTSDIWTKPARTRIATSWAGPYSGLILAGLSSILVEFMPGSPIASILQRLAFLWILILVFNLIPLLELDGYFMLIDWLEVPMLRAKALTFVRRELWSKLRQRELLTGEQRLLAWFGVLSLIFSAGVVVLSVAFWRTRLTPVVQELWAAGVGARIVLVLLIFALALPVIFGMGTRVFLVGRAAASWTRTRWRQPRRRTLRERKTLLEQVRFLAQLSEEQLAEVAARLHRETFGPGETVLRQGEAGDRFYLIERGTAEVFVGNDSHPRVVLATGNYFGELALLHNVPRTATVRAGSALGVLWLTKGDFERLLSPHVAASAQIDEAIYALERLRSFPIFANLSSRELDELAIRLQREQFPAGATIVAEGERGEAFYLIDSGQAEVMINGQRVRTIGRGEHFGEIALVLDVPRTATVRALTPLDLWKLHRTDFDTLVGTTLSQITGTLEAVARERLLVPGDLEH